MWNAVTIVFQLWRASAGAGLIAISSTLSLVFIGVSLREGKGCEAAIAASEDQASLSTASGFLFLSPNTRAHLTPAEASLQLQSDEHRRFRRIAEQILGQIGLSDHRTFNSIGDWSDGVENSIYVEIRTPTDLAALGYAAAHFGLQAGQRAVLVCRADPHGNDGVYELEFAENNLASLRRTLDRYGLPFRTFIPKDAGYRVVIFDENRQWRAKVAALATSPGSPLKEIRATGKYLGGDTLHDARERFSRVIRDYEARQPTPSISKIRGVTKG